MDNMKLTINLKRYKEFLSRLFSTSFTFTTSFTDGSNVFNICSKINIYFGIGVFLTEIIYVLYKKSLKPKVVSEIENIKNNINTNGEQILKQKGKKDISFLISILLIGVITHFSWIIILSFCIVLGVTIRDIYLNYKNSI